MTFELFGIDFYWREKLFGFWIGGLRHWNKDDNLQHRNLFGIYWEGYNLLIDFLFFHLKED